MKTFTDSNFVELLIKYRDLSTEEAFLFYDKILSEKDYFLNNTEYLSVLFNGFFDDALDLSYMAEVLDIIREFKLKIDNDLYIKQIISEVEAFIPHAHYWYSLLLMDIIVPHNVNIIIETIKLLTPDVKTVLVKELKQIQIDDYWGKDKILQELIQHILQSIGF